MGPQKVSDLDVPHEGAWAYMQVPADSNWKTTLADTCEAAGWMVVERSSYEGQDPELSFEHTREAILDSEFVVAVLTGSDTPTSEAELLLAREHGRPIVGIQYGGAEVSPFVQGMLSGYERARLVTCSTEQECITTLETLLADREFAAVIRGGASEFDPDG